MKKTSFAVMLNLFKQPLISIAILCQPVFSSAQIMFQRTYGGSGYDEGRCVKQTWDGGYIIAGSTSSFGAGSTDVYLLKVDSLGNPQWQKTFGGTNIDKGYSLDICSDSGFVICGYTNSFGNGGYDTYLIRTDKNGGTIWTKTYGGTDWDFGYSVKKTSDGGFVLAGGTYSYGNGDEDVYVIKTNSVGDTLWTKTFGGANGDEAKSIKQTSDGGYVLTGYTKSFADINGDVYTIKINATGVAQWTKQYGGAGADEGADIIESANSDFVIVGGTKSFSPSGDFDVYNLRTSSIGDTLWIRAYGASVSHNYGTSVVEMPSGKFAFCDITEDLGGGLRDCHLFISAAGGYYDSGGSYGSSGNEEPYSIDYCTDNGFILCGISDGFSTVGTDIYLVKTDSIGGTSPIFNYIEENSFASDNITLYPNPVQSSYITIIYPGNIADTKIILTDWSGRTLKTSLVTFSDGRIIIPVAHLASGIYFVTFQNAKGITGHVKFLRSR